MSYDDQEKLPGGRIRPRETSSQGTRWRSEDADDEPLDTELERTTLRKGPRGWYIVTAPTARPGRKRPSKPSSRCGPFEDPEEAARVLRLEAEADGTTRGEDRSKKRAAAINATVNQVIREWLTYSLFEASRQWLQAVDAQLEQDAGTDQGVAAGWERQRRLCNEGTAADKRLEKLKKRVIETARELARKTSGEGQR